jgi:hypothetical protein
MIKFFRKIRQKMLNENKFGKYLTYAVGEIVLVVIGILIALQINNWNQEREDNKLKVFYMNSLANDLNKDTLDINHITQIQIADNKTTTEYLRIIYNPNSNIDSIIKVAKQKDDSFRVKRDYSNNTFNTIISSGNIELLDKDLVDKLMDLNSLQLDQLKRFDSNLDAYTDLVSYYLQHFPRSKGPEGNIVDAILWNNVDEKILVSSLTNTLYQRKFMFRNTIRGHLRVKEKSREILELIESLLEK